MGKAELEEYNSHSSDGTGFDVASALGGSVWRSERHSPSAVCYEALPPAGLHIGCGLAHLSTISDELGGFSARGPAFTALYVPEGAAPFRTAIGAGHSRSCGLFIPEASFDVLDPALSSLNAAMEGPGLKSITGDAARISAQLCAPIDPWFQGVARALVLEARGLELAAFALTWLTGNEERTSDASTMGRRAMAARDVLESRLADPPTLEALARQIGINPRSLTEAFRQTFGSSIGAYVTARRLDTALRLLEQGLGAVEAAHAVGYRPTHFSVAFRRRFAVSPSEFRRRPSSR